ncbi:fimbrial protein [uncultured Cedecea sp.]|uniref:fimbrial protein n=1 Tax=uncultured Cedecea sp. TaxID=988762 RepID=UPI00261E9DCB|nr:fimbrial protein [uncultured Cedecea sp.]
MKLIHVISIGVLALSSSVYAVDGTINFTGEITSNTCTIDGSVAGAATKTVALGNVPASALSAAGQTAGNKNFSLTLTDCSAVTSVAARFESLDLASTDGYLQLSPPAGATPNAENVEIAIYDNNGVLQPVNGEIPSTSYVNLEDGDAVLNYIAAYYATGVATVGPANSVVSYTLSYQ